jgi:hypothetical protein
LTKTLSPKSYNRWVRYLQMKDEDAWKTRDKWEIYAADILDMLYSLLPTRMPPLKRKDFLLQFKTEAATGPPTEGRSRVRQYRGGRKRWEKVKLTKKQQEDSLKKEMCIWGGLLGVAEMIPDELPFPGK